MHFTKVPENFQGSGENVRNTPSAMGLLVDVPGSTWAPSLGHAVEAHSTCYLGARWASASGRQECSRLSGLALRPEHLLLPGVLPECCPSSSGEEPTEASPVSGTWGGQLCGSWEV